MTESQYRSVPEDTTGMPSGVPYIIGNELAERFSFYGMKAILTVFMTKHLLDAAGQPDPMADEQAKSVYHLFTAGAYFFPMIGAMISDVLWGKYKTILLISLMYCLGHGSLALMDLGPMTGSWNMRPFLYIGLILIAVGAGGIKPCVSAHVGDQFGPGNKDLLTQVFNWFYFSINLGAAASTFLTPILLVKFGPWAAFGLPGILMAIATFLFWMGRHKFIHVPPSGWEQFKQETLSPEGLRAIRNLTPLFLVFVPLFWAIFDQTGSAWVLQAESMNRNFVGMEWLESQVQVVNPVLILTLIPVFTYLVYPAMGFLFNPTPLRKVGIGFVLTAMAFGISGLIEQAIEDRQSEPTAALWQAVMDSDTAPETMAAVQSIAEIGGVTLDDAGESDVAAAWAQAKPTFKAPGKLRDAVRAARSLGWEQSQIRPFTDGMPNIGWQFLAYFVLTSAEILVSIVCLEFAYTQSPPRMKSFIMGVYFLGVSLGNLYVSGLNIVMDVTRDDQGRTFLDGPLYYYAFSIAMLVATIGFIVFALRYKGETYIHGDVHPNVEAAAVADGTEG
ncbi:MAG: POT family MFS transporter [Planctomycetaceae bacterium]